MELTFKEFSRKNRERMLQWHEGDTVPWTGADWGNATAGEMGEACNVVKKLRRLETRVGAGNDDEPETELRQQLADELADTVAYLDLLAQHYDIDLGVAVADKFNCVSEREGFPQVVSRGYEELPMNVIGNDVLTLGRLSSWIIEHRDRELHPAGMMAGEVLDDIRRRFGPDVFPLISMLDINDALREYLGPPNER